MVNDHQQSYWSPWIRKPLSVVYQQEHVSQNIHDRSSEQSTTSKLVRHLSVWDLIGIGVGSTVGSGVFVLTGQIASQNSGPAAFISLAIAGFAAACSGVCYAELSARLPAAGSTYVYAYTCWGEMAAVVAAACVTLEYGVSGAAVARTWGDKVIVWTHHIFTSKISDDDMMQEATENSVSSWLLPFDGAVNVPAFFVSALATCLLMAGVSTSKAVTNWITLFKMIIVIFMIIGGFCLYDPQNMPPSVPLAPFGMSGIFRGATASFFGFLGYDEVCCVAGEALHPSKDMPRAVLGTLLITTLSYVLGAIALTGMLPFEDISPTSGFPAAFSSRGIEWASHLTAIGELTTLPVVALICLLAQPRLMYSMAQDGLIARIFAKVSSDGNLTAGTAITGFCMTIIATCVPFTYLDDLISAGILVAFSMTNSCLVLLRCKPKDTTADNGMPSFLLQRLLILYNFLCFTSSMLWSHPVERISWGVQGYIALFSTASTIVTFLYMVYSCPITHYFGGTILSKRDMTFASQKGLADVVCNENLARMDNDESDDYFVTPAVPLLPCVGMAINWYLIAQLDATGLLLLCVYLFLTICTYGLFCAPHSIGHLRYWNNSTYEVIEDVVDCDHLGIQKL